MYEVILIIHVILAAMLIGLVLLQQGKGGGMGTAFGSGTEALFSSSGVGNVLSRGTAIIATLFFVTSLSLGFLAAQKSRQMHQDLVPVAIPQPDTVLMTVPTPQDAAPITEVPAQKEAAPKIPQ